MKPLIAFNYFGGKYRHVDWINSLLPQSNTFVEVFGGSAVVLLNRNPSRIECYNDLNSIIVNFFQVLRDHPDDLINQIILTPYSREEYFNCYKTLKEGNNIERARKFFVCCNQSFNGTYQRQTGWKMSTVQSRSIIAEAINRWLTKIPNLAFVVNRFRKVQITNFDFRVIFKKFDSPGTLFYCDPPYMHSLRCNNNEYTNEMSEQDHIDLLQLCINLKGKVAISGYDSLLYNSYLKDFYKTIAPVKRNILFHSTRQEIIWSNYKPTVQTNLFIKD